MILLAWAKEKSYSGFQVESVNEPKVLALSHGETKLTLIQDLTYEILISDDKPIGKKDAKSVPGRDMGESLRMVVVNQCGDAENVIKLDQGTLSSLIGAPLPTLELTRILNNLSSIFNNIRRQKPSDARQVIEMAKIVRNMDELSRVLTPTKNSVSKTATGKANK